jgi:hypothetical protein
MRKSHLLATTAALLAAPFLALPASASPCVNGTIGSYEALGATGCTVGGVTFSNFNVNTTVSGTGSVAFASPNSVIVTSGGGEFGLELEYSANTGSTPGSTADVAWTYNVSGNLLSDAFAELAGTTSGTGTINVSEVLTNGTTLTLLGAGSTSTTFTPIGSLGVIKDQDNYAGSAGSSDASILVNEFSLTSTPIPATLPLLATGLLGLWGVSRKRRKGSRLGSAQA